VLIISIFVLNYIKIRVLAQNFCIFGQQFSDKTKIFVQFFDSQSLGWAIVSYPLPATTPLKVNYIFDYLIFLIDSVYVQKHTNFEQLKINPSMFIPSSCNGFPGFKPFFVYSMEDERLQQNNSKHTVFFIQLSRPVSKFSQFTLTSISL